MSGHRTRALSVAVTVTVVMTAVLSGCLQGNEPPSLIVDESVAGDLEALAEETWDSFLSAFPARTSCFGDVRLRATRTLDSRAGYDPGSATVTVRVPGTPAMLQSALIHEWAHHIEFRCEEHRHLRPAFLAAQGLPPDTTWRPDNTPANTPASMWADVPSEQYAEAVIVLVLGRRQILTGVYVTDEAVQAVRAWAAGD